MDIKHTDLALEAKKIWENTAQDTTSLPGVKARTEDMDGYEVTTVDILDDKGSEILCKPKVGGIVMVGEFVDKILMQTSIHIAGIENIRRCLTCCTFVFFKNRCSRKSDKVCVLEISANITVHFAELTSMTFVDNKHTFFRLVRFHNRLIFLVTKCAGEFLNGRNKHFFSAVFQTLNEFRG